MPIFYRSFYPEHQRLDETIEGPSALYFDPVAERFPTVGIGDRFRRLDPVLRRQDFLLFRGRTSAFVDSLQEDRTLAALVGKTPAAAIVGSISPGQPPSIVPIPGWEFPDYPLDTSLLRRIELSALIEKSRAIFRGADSHFVLPSGAHADAFVRIGDALHAETDVLRLTDWIMPHVGQNSAILVDNGSMLALAFALRLETLRLFQWDLPMTSLGSYPSETVELAHAVNDLVAFKGLDTSVLFLVSVNSTGYLIDQFRAIAPQNSKVVVICNTGHQSEEANVLLDVPVPRWAVDENGRCSECDRSHARPIDDKTYEILPDRTWNRVVVGRAAADKHRWFWEAADAAEAVSLHVDIEYPEGGGGRLRHYGIYLDIARLLANANFRARCITGLRQIETPKLVFIPRHRATPAIESLVAEAFGAVPTIAIGEGSLTTQADLPLSKLSVGDLVLIADDALVSGTTLHGLREEVYRANPQVTVHAFVAVARPPDRATVVDLQRRYRDQNGVRLSWAHQVYLPHGDLTGRRISVGCPWCDERDLLTQHAEHLSREIREYADRRILMLTGSAQVPALFGSDLDHPDPRRTVGSFFGNLGPSAAFAAAVAMCQEIRVTMNPPDRASTIDIVDLPMAIGAYYDEVFLAAILRTFARKELIAQIQIGAITRALEFLRSHRVHPITVLEVGWAAVNGKVPTAAGLSLLIERDTGSPTFNLLRTLLEQVHRPQIP